MMPAGLLLMWVELWFLSRVIRTDTEAGSTPQTNPGGARTPTAPQPRVSTGPAVVVAHSA
jgi:hypothetical protein